MLGQGVARYWQPNQVQSTPGIIWPNLGTGRTAVKVELGRWHGVLLDNSMSNAGVQMVPNRWVMALEQQSATPKKVNFASGCSKK